MKYLIICVLLISFSSCDNIKDENMAETPEPSKILEVTNNNLTFIGNQADKEKAFELLDKVIRDQGDLGALGNLTAGIEDLKKDCDIKVVDEKDYYDISISPSSSNGGHDFSFTIDKETGKRSDVAVGSVLPDPDFEE